PGAFPGGWQTPPGGSAGQRTLTHLASSGYAVAPPWRSAGDSARRFSASESRNPRPPQPFETTSNDSPLATLPAVCQPPRHPFEETHWIDFSILVNYHYTIPPRRSGPVFSSSFARKSTERVD